MPLYVREPTQAEEQQLREWLDSSDPELSHRARVILLSKEGYRIPEIGAMMNAHPTNLRKWIHRFNEQGLEGLVSLRSGGPPPRFSETQKAQIIELAKTNPRDVGLPTNRWTLHMLAEESEKRGIVESISHEYVRQVLIAAGIDLRTPPARWREAGPGTPDADRSANRADAGGRPPSPASS